MVPGQAPAVTGPRIGLVLGAGGVLGAAWMTGVLPALQQRLPCALSSVDVIVGTSAGSVLAAALRCGASVDEIIAYQRGEAAGPLQGVPPAADGPLPPFPRWRLGSPPLMLASLVTPRRVHRTVGASAWLPRGRGQHRALRAMVQALHQHARLLAGPGGSPPDWTERRTWIVAVDYRSGQRVIFGRDGAPPAPLADAVVASCSIPGWYEPAVINGRRYVDGGVRSPTSLGVLAGEQLDEVYVLAPMASLLADQPRRPLERIERPLRRLITRGLLREAQALESAGIRVTVLTPGPEDLAVMGVNLMDPRRCQAVLETSLRTAAATLSSQDDGQSLVA